MSTWEDRMAARAAERAARRDAAQAEIDARYPESPQLTGHERHHWHIPYGLNYRVCSCGQPDNGCWTIGPDNRYWSDDPAEVAAVKREDADFKAWLTCHICGQKGVQADDTFGTWPPADCSQPEPLDLSRPLSPPVAAIFERLAPPCSRTY